MKTNKLTGIQKWFPLLGEKNVNFKREMLAGLVTFLTMAYIIAVNPGILSATGMDAGALVTATCLAAAVGCFAMGFMANLPFALASGMGLNAFFAFTVVLKGGISWQMALTAVFIEGIIFILLTLFKVSKFNTFTNETCSNSRNRYVYCFCWNVWSWIDCRK